MSVCLQGPVLAAFQEAGGHPHKIVDGTAQWAFLCSSSMVKIDVSQVLLQVLTSLSLCSPMKLTV